MSITIAELLKLEVFLQAKIVAGEGGLGNCVEKVSVIETPDAGLWFKGGELFVSAFYSVKNSPDLQIEMIKCMKRAGSAGLVVCYRERYVKEISPEAIDFANLNDIPIIELPEQDVYYYQIISLVSDVISHKKTLQLEYAQEVHTNMINLILNGKGFAEIGKNLEHTVKNPVVLMDRNSAIIYRSPSLQAVMSEIETVLQNNQSNSPNYANIRLPWTRLELLEVGKSLVVVPIIVGHELSGQMLIVEENEQLDEWKLIAVQEISLVVALEQARQNAILEVEKRYKKGFLDELLTGQITSHEAIMERAHSLGFDLARYSIILVLEVTADANYFLRLTRLVEQIVRRQDDKSVVLEKTNGSVVLPYINKQKSLNEVIQQARQMAQNIIQAIKREFPNLEAFIGISNYFGKIEDMSKACKEAYEALKIIRSLKDDNIGFFYELEGYAILNQLTDSESLQGFYQHAYGPLLEYDRINGTELVKTLETYFLCGGNSVKTAQRLFLHRNSMKYRKLKIIKVLGNDPFEGTRYTNYLIATVAKQLLTK